jgi:signal transduction histidine kinase
MAALRRAAAAGADARERAVAVVRLAFLPAAIVGHEVRDGGDGGADPFLAWLAAATVYALATLALSRADRVHVPLPALLAVDLGFLVVLAHHAGGPAPPGAWVATQVVYATWLGAASILFCAALARRSRRIGELAAARGRLVAELLGAEERERRRIATLLHDGPIQQLMLARAKLSRAAASDDEDLRAAEEAVTEAIGQLRGTMQDLHPYVLDFAGLGPALESAGDRAMPQGMSCAVDVDRDATGYHDEILYAVARELLVNAAKHADGRHVTVQVARTGDLLELRVRDDGRGFDDARRLASLREGHIGLASCAQRVEALGGRFEVHSRPGAGTDVRVRMPIRPAALEEEAAAGHAARQRRSTASRPAVAGGQGGGDYR